MLKKLMLYFRNSTKSQNEMIENIFAQLSEVNERVKTLEKINMKRAKNEPNRRIMGAFGKYQM
jgi:hypothetical protein